MTRESGIVSQPDALSARETQHERSETEERIKQRKLELIRNKKKEHAQVYKNHPGPWKSE